MPSSSDDPPNGEQITRPIEGDTTVEVIRMVAVYTNREPEELPPLTDTIDPDTLEAIFVPRPDGTRRPGGEVRFTYASCRVRVKAGREIVVEPTHEGG